ncbi:MAG: NAD(P)/FAD-dependent oxidoreductase, partial [bacterium]|nr:NAD(P)/FAD-dependent oxidoreductase [bacterium]
MKHLILGFSAAGANAAETIRRLDADAEITVVSADPREFYLRLDLEGIFHGKSAAELMPRPPEYWRENHISVVHDEAAGVDAALREVRTASERALSYDR